MSPINYAHPNWPISQFCSENGQEDNINSRLVQGLNFKMSKMSKDGAIDVTIELEIKIGNKQIRYILIELFWGGGWKIDCAVYF